MRIDASEVVEALARAGCPVEQAEEGGRTPLMLAAAYGRIGALPVLLEHGAEPLRRHPERGTAREVATPAECQGCEEIVAQLRGAEARLGDSPLREPTAEEVAAAERKRPSLTEKHRFKKLSRQFMDAALNDRGLARRLVVEHPALLETYACSARLRCTSPSWRVASTPRGSWTSSAPMSMHATRAARPR